MKQLLVLGVLTLVAGCSQANDMKSPGAAVDGGASTSTGGAATTGGGASLGGTGTVLPPVEENTGLTSPVFGSIDDVVPDAGGGPEPCEYPTPPTCDYTRIDGCCSHLACSKASGSDVDNPYPIESCNALVACVQANPGCSTADDPLCFGNEAGPCVDEGYQASHEDLEGPFWWTVDLMRCVCGY